MPGKSRAAWWQQLAPADRLVLALRWHGQTRSVALARMGDELIYDSIELCGFVPMIGEESEHSAHPEPAATSQSPTTKTRRWTQPPYAASSPAARAHRLVRPRRRLPSLDATA